MVEYDKRRIYWLRTEVKRKGVVLINWWLCMFVLMQMVEYLLIEQQEKLKHTVGQRTERPGGAETAQENKFFDFCKTEKKITLTCI